MSELRVCLCSLFTFHCSLFSCSYSELQFSDIGLFWSSLILSSHQNNISKMKSGKDEEGIVPREAEKDIIDKALQYGKYQSLLIWIFGTSIGTNHRSVFSDSFDSLTKFQPSSGRLTTSSWSSCWTTVRTGVVWSHTERCVTRPWMGGEKSFKLTTNSGWLQVLRAFAVGERSSLTPVIQTSFTHWLWNINGSVRRWERILKIPAVLIN